MYRSIIIVFFVALSQFVSGQQAVLHLDKPYYTTGEVAWYKLYLPDTYADMDAKIEVQISSTNGAIVDSYFLDADAKGYVSGYWNIPYTLKTGVYALSFVTHEPKQQKSEVITSYSVDVYNDLERLDQSITQASQAGKAPVSDNSSSMQIKTNKSTYQPREDITIDVILKDESGNPITGNCSVSISNMDLIGKDEIVKAIKSQNVKNIQDWAPSDKLVFRGVVTDTSATPIKINVLGLYSDQNKKMYLGKSNTQGTYSVGTDDFYGKLPVQALGFILNEVDQIDIKPLSKGVKAQGSVGYSPQIDEYIAASRLNKKIRQFYKTSSPLNIAKIKNEVFERKPNADYDFDEYEPFDEAANFFNETNTSRLKFSTKEGKLESVMYNPKGSKRNFKFPNPPTFIVDGKVTKDANLVGRLPFKDVATAELYFLSKNIKSTFGTNGGYGYAIFNTKKGDFSLRQEEGDDMLSISGLQRSAQFNSGMIADNTEVPDFKATIYWNANVPVTNGVAKIRISQSDDISTYLITIVGKTIDGDIVSKALPYQVNLTK